MYICSVLLVIKGALLEINNVVFFIMKQICVSVSPTLFHLQDLTGVNLHLRFPVSLVFAKPAVTGKHVILSVDRNHDLNAVQEPTSTHPFVGVTNHQTVYLKSTKKLGWVKQVAPQ